MPSLSARSGARAALDLAVIAAMVGVLGIIVLDLAPVLPLPADGPIGLARLFAEHLTLAAVVVLPVAIVGGARARWLRVALLALLVVAVVRFGDEWWSPPGADAGRPSLTVMTWNLEDGSRPGTDAPAELAGLDADVVGFVELTPVVARSLDRDPDLDARFPHRAFFASDDVYGLGLSSRWPLEEVVFERGPSRLSAIVDSPEGPIRVMVVHPLHGRITTGPRGLPIGYDPSGRDETLDRLRSDVDRLRAEAEPVIVMGDINTAPTEDAFDRFRGDLVDAHAAVGLGTGWTYRPDSLEPLGIGLIRIDVIFSEPVIRPVSAWTHCPRLGDHCAVLASYVRWDGSP